MKFPTSQHSVIYADPAWSYEMYGETGYEKSPDAHYETMTLDELKALREDLLWATAPHAVCIMWAVFPMLPQALELLAHWGFTYITGGPWNKITAHGKRAFGTGFVLRGSSELFLIGKLGEPVLKNKSTRNNLFTGDIPEDLKELGVMLSTIRREHSRKPDEMIPLIENLFEGPYLELFARTRREGWTVWGNQIDKFEASA